MNYRDFVDGMNTAYRHKGGIKTLALGRISPAWFRQIQADCAWIIEGADSSDVGDKGHVTNWTRPSGEVRQFSLFNTSGRSEDTAGDYGYLGDVKKKRLVFPQLEGLSRFARLFMPDLRNLRLNGMGPNSALSAHEESSIQATRLGLQHVVRFHLPVFTNAGARMFLDDEWFPYAEGTVYFFHHGCVHAAANGGNEPRYHLVLDCFFSKGLFQRLFPGQSSPDADYSLTTDAEAVVAPIEHHHFPEFVCEGGQVIAGPIDYGRRLPHWVDWYRTNYPSVFSPLSR